MFFYITIYNTSSNVKLFWFFVYESQFIWFVDFFTISIICITVWSIIPVIIIIEIKRFTWPIFVVTPIRIVTIYNIIMWIGWYGNYIKIFNWFFNINRECISFLIIYSSVIRICYKSIIIWCPYIIPIVSVRVNKSSFNYSTLYNINLQQQPVA